MIRAILLLALLLPYLNASASNFPRPASLEPAVQFWIKVYTEIPTSAGYIHDSRSLNVIYDTIELPGQPGDAGRQRLISDARDRVASALSILGGGKRSNLSITEETVLSAWPQNTSSNTFAAAAKNVRFQLGQSNRFKEGLIRSGQWKPHIRQTLRAHNLPAELEVLPHVESSFNPAAYSKVAAAGMWQFMPATARQFMRVDHVVDERMDPYAATEGAAKLLKRNYGITGTWPLALTGYNHGAGGMVRASKVLGTQDIAVIVERYRGRAFGFASRNFYTSFLAALEIDSDPERFFGPIKFDRPTRYDVVTLQEFIAADNLAQSTGISLDELRLHNPSLRATVWSGEKHIPQGYSFRVPSTRLAQPLARAVADLSSDARHTLQQPDLEHRIASGDSLSTIARKYGTSVSRLMALNGLHNHKIRSGKNLILPGNTRPVPANASLAARAAASQGSFEYTIREGDSLWSIARRFKVSQKQLVSWNGISSKKYLQPGQKLKIATAG
ncbi:MAG: LysM peptidoglycan-binding domain-containing protein [Halioglobus sp.]|nr:LysM peptidoglycan-binding domain-containing protein [Halioglobus sp.]